MKVAPQQDHILRESMAIYTVIKSNHINKTFKNKLKINISDTK